MSELKPCPFCGGKASIKGDWGLETLSCDDRTGDCPGSWVSLPCHRPERRAASIAAWNARAAAPAAPTPAWQPIETAPKDEEVLLFGQMNKRAFTGAWGGYMRFNQPRITHWMPLPAPPAIGAGKGGKP